MVVVWCSGSFGLWRYPTEKRETSVVRKFVFELLLALVLAGFIDFVLEGFTDFVVEHFLVLAHVGAMELMLEGLLDIVIKVPLMVGGYLCV